jgi:thiamine pyrophosphokinase
MTWRRSAHLTRIRAVIVADGEIDLAVLRATLVPAAGETVLAIGADGGTRHFESAGRLPDLVCGDADSLDADELQRLRDRGTAVELHPSDKDESDTELCVRAALERGAAQIVILGALGGSRVEHGIANQLLLAAPLLDGMDAVMLHGATSIRRIGTVEGPGRVEIDGTAEDFVSLLPLDDPVTGVSTDGLRYPLSAEALAIGSTRGLSNELTGHHAAVTTTGGRLLVIHTPRPEATAEAQGAAS